MAGAAIARQETVRVAINAHTALTADRGTFRIAQARIDRSTCRFALARELDRRIGRQLPGEIELQVAKFRLQQSRISESRALVFSRMPCDRTGLGHHVLDRLGGQITRARRTLAMTEVHRDAERAVTLVLDRFHFAKAHRHRKPLLQTRIGLRLRCTGATRGLERSRDHVFEFRYTRCIDLL